MKLIREEFDAKISIIEEAAGKPKQYFIEGITLQSDLKNRNGRIYPYDMMANEANRYVTEMINKNRAVGELGHPASPTVNYDRASHKFLSLKEDNKNWVSKAKVLGTPLGETVKRLMDDDVQFGISSRGTGSLKESRDGSIVQNDYRLATAGDIVSDPSAPDAFVRGIMENAEWIWSNGVLVEAEVAAAKTLITKAKQHELEEVALSVFQNLINKL